METSHCCSAGHLCSHPGGSNTPAQLWEAFLTDTCLEDEDSTEMYADIDQRKHNGFLSSEKGYGSSAAFAEDWRWTFYLFIALEATCSVFIHGFQALSEEPGTLPLCPKTLPSCPRNSSDSKVPFWQSVLGDLCNMQTRCTHNAGPWRWGKGRITVWPLDLVCHSFPMGALWRLCEVELSTSL